MNAAALLLSLTVVTDKKRAFNMHSTIAIQYLYVKITLELWTFILLDKKLINCNMIQRLCSSFSRMMSWLNVLQAYLDNIVWVSKPCRPWEYFDLYFSTWCFITKYKYLIAVIGAWCQRPIRGSSVHPGVSVEYRPILQERSSFIKSRQQVGAQFYSLIHFVQTGEGKRMLR